MTAPIHAGGEAGDVIATVAELRCWVAEARKGDVFAYATRCWLPVPCAAAAEARRLHRDGVALHSRVRVPGTSIFSYRLTRTDVQLPRAAAGRAAEAGVPGDVLDTIYSLVERAAHFARPCPTDGQLAERADCSRATAAAALAELAETGAIAVQSVRAPTLRRVMIAATGRRTGEVR